jgi:ATP-dependent Clp protease protease subunit
MNDEYCDCDDEECFVYQGEQCDIHIVGEIDAACSQRVPALLYSLDVDEATGDSPIELHLDSPGGCPFSAFHIVDMISSLGHSVIGFGKGRVASAALPIFAACDYRVCGKNTVFLTHSCRGSLDGANMDDLKSHQELIGKLNYMTARILGEKTEKDLEWWLSKIESNQEFYFFAEEALEWGLVHEVV